MREFIREKVKTDKCKESYEIFKCPLLSLTSSPQPGNTFLMAPKESMGQSLRSRQSNDLEENVVFFIEKVHDFKKLRHIDKTKINISRS